MSKLRTINLLLLVIFFSGLSHSILGGNTLKTNSFFSKLLFQLKEITYKQTTTLKLDSTSSAAFMTSACTNDSEIAGWYFNGSNYTGAMGSGDGGIAPDFTDACATVSVMNRQSGTNSTTDGNTGRAICIGAFGVNNTWVDDYAGAVEFTITFPASKSGRLSKLEFYQQSPFTNHWYPEDIDICNNPAQKFGFRVLKDGVEIYENIDLATTINWQAESFDFTGNTNFEYTNGAVFTFELAAYDKNDVNCWNSIINQEPVMWDLDDVKVFGCCVSQEICGNWIDDDGDLDIDGADSDCNLCGNTTLYLADFESVLGANNWTLGTGATDGDWEINTPNPYTQSGATVMELTAYEGTQTLLTGNGSAQDLDGGPTTAQSPNINLTAGATNISLDLYYYLSHYTNGDNSDYLTISVKDASNNNTLETVVNEIGAATDRDAIWTQVTTDLTAHAGKTIYIYVTAADLGGGSKTEAAIDNVIISETISCANPTFSCASGILNNPDFESGVTDWTFQSNTSLSNDAHFGSQAAYANGGNGGPSQNYAATPDKVYSFSVYAKKNATEDATIGIKFFDAAWAEIDANYKQVTSNNYEAYFLSMKAPANAAHVQILGWKSTGTGEAWWDGFCVEEWDFTPPNCNVNCQITPSFQEYIFSLGLSEYDNFMDYDNGDLTFCDNGDGTLSIKGNIINGQDADWAANQVDPCGSKDAWFVDLLLFDRQLWADFQGQYVVNANCPDAYLGLDFYDVSGTLTGLGCNVGRTIDVHGPSTGNSGGYRMQIGSGGNSQSCDYGMSTWFEATENGTPVFMDIYAHLDSACYVSMRPPPTTSNSCDNTVDNQEFDNGTNDWYVFGHTGNTVTWSVDNTSQLAGTNAAKVEISATSGSEDWRISFGQQNHSFETGKTYTFSFDAKAAANRTISAGLQKTTAGFDGYLWETVNLTTAMQSFSFSFTPSVTNTNDASIVFNLGGNATTVWVDNVVYKEDCSNCPTQTVSVQVNANSDDAEENLSSNSVSLGSSDLELAEDSGNSQLIGMRFNGMNIPNGATITNAYIEFETDVAWTSAASLTIQGQDSDNPNTFTSTASDLSNTSSRPKTSATIPWTPGNWNSENEKHQTPNLKLIIQEIINRSGWASGNSMALFIQGTGTREAESYNGEPTAAPLLVIEYEDCSTTEICDNGLDDDGDGLIDCGDPDCTEGTTDPSCTAACEGNNMGFENDLANWTVMGSPSISNDAYVGSKSAYLNADAERLRQTLTVEGDSLYQISFWAKGTVGGSDWSGVVLRFFDSGGTYIGQLDAKTWGYTDWNQFVKFVVAPENAATMELELAVWGNSTDMYFDEICFQKSSYNLPIPSQTGCEIYATPEGSSSFWYDTDLGWIVYDLHEGGVLTDNGDGTKTIRATVTNGKYETAYPCGEIDGWEVEVTMADKQNWTQFGGSFDGNSVSDNGCTDYHTDWDYWDITGGTITGLGCNTGTSYNVLGNVSGYRFQIGYGANRSSCNFGMAGWIEYDRNGTTKTFDFYVDIDEACYNYTPPEICNNNIDDDGDGDIDCADSDCNTTTVYIGADTTICDGDNVTLSAALSNCTSGTCTGTTISSFPYTESFESGLGDWTQTTNSSGDDIDWVRDASGTPSSTTGPSNGADGSYYLFTEASTAQNGNPNKAAIFNSPCFDLQSAATAAFDFQYHMYGAHIGILGLEISTDNGTNWTSLWSLSGDQGNSWNAVNIDLSSYAGKLIRLRFNGVTGSSYYGDMAFDDLSLTTSPITYSWSTGATSASINVSPSSTTTYTVDVTVGGTTISDSRVVSVSNCTIPTCIGTITTPCFDNGSGTVTDDRYWPNIDLSGDTDNWSYTASDNQGNNWTHGASGGDLPHSYYRTDTYPITIDIVGGQNGCTQTFTITDPPACSVACDNLAYTEVSTVCVNDSMVTTINITNTDNTCWEVIRKIDETTMVTLSFEQGDGIFTLPPVAISDVQATATPTNYTLWIHSVDCTDNSIVFYDCVQDLVINVPTCSEICDNNIDDDGDGLVDNADPDCNTCPTGTISFERWLNIGAAASVSNLTGHSNYPDNPDEIGTLTSFEGPTNYNDNYGTRIRGFLHPSETGNYVFTVTSDDGSEVYLSPDSEPNNKVKISEITDWTGPTEFTKFASQTSSSIALTAGEKYYIEVLHKEGGGGDNLALYWQTPSNNTRTLIDGAYLSPWQCDCPSGPAVVLGYTDEYCGNSGTIIVHHQDDPLASSYSYNWSNGQTSQIATNLTANNTYSVTVTNNDNGCATTAYFADLQQTAIRPTLNIQCGNSPMKVRNISDAPDCAGATEYSFQLAGLLDNQPGFTKCTNTHTDDWCLVESGTIEEYADGSAFIDMTVIPNCLPNERLRVVASLRGRTNSGSPYKTNDCSGNAWDVSQMYFYPDVEGYILGLNGLSGGIAYIRDTGPPTQLVLVAMA